ncbi:phycobilisome protein [Gloeocapsopsis dulcis]|uniref:Phycobilisome protein n=1 Tax=Gloeocapsopsis dulcis AAB1 = 1H9 TaxID=1433147 RepID=A0A6N8FV78_9CHRO|nr:phycobilisome protein [Gloeocapsopsis dulcis]MUL36851.1 phycobilisome protein [Gloeocapsopsis dulcis AAB1 = 1H9]WNN88541.1 phycobilisome protein [Gloeocapsopsis dulcis]
MHPEIKTLLYEAEDCYLKPEEIKTFKYHVSSLQARLETYELLCEQEVVIFQPIADQLLKTFPQQQETLERTLKRWLSVLRYCAMAMLLNNQEFLQRRLLEWLTELVQAHQTQEIEMRLYQLLQTQLKELLTEQQLALLQPFLEQAETTLLRSSALTQL